MNAEQWYLSKFPEALYPCRPELIKEYRGRIISGKGIMSKAKVCICGIGRNIEDILPATIARIKKLCRMFLTCDIFIYENDSNDNTLNILNKWKTEDENLYLISEKLYRPLNQQDKSLLRRKAMAYARNKYLQACRNSGKNYEYVIVIDMDLLGGWSYEGIANSFGWSEIWDMIAANSIYYNKIECGLQKLFFDSWAFRRLGHPEPHNEKDINLLNYNRGEPPVRVFSAFGGLSIYRGECILNNKFEYKDNDCDHPTMNKQLTDIGKTIWLNPSMITLYSETEYVS